MQSLLNFYFGQFRVHAHTYPLCRTAFLVYDKDKNLFPTLVQELQSAIDLFHQYTSDHSITPYAPYLKNANHLGTILGKQKLPPVAEIASFDDVVIKNIFTLFDKFQFIKIMQNPTQLAIALVPAFYRTYVLATQPNLLEQHAQVASALEEMFGILALDGKETKTFHAIKHWIVQYDEEDFDPRFATNIQQYLEKGLYDSHR